MPSDLATEDLKLGVDSRLDTIERELDDIAPGHGASTNRIAVAIFDLVLLMLEIHRREERHDAD